jgi:hypothetical protein
MLEAASKKVKEQAFYMKRAMDQSDLKQVCGDLNTNVMKETLLDVLLFACYRL